MNKIVKGLFLAMMFASMCACSSDDASLQTAQVETSLVSFSFFDASMEKFDVASRAGETRAAKTWKEYFSRLDIAIFPADGAKNDSVYRIHQLAGSDNFGSLSLRLPIGKYTMVAVASKATSEVDIASSVLATFPGEIPTDMAYVSQTIEVKSGATTVNSVLKRSLTKFIVSSSDSLNMDVAKADLTFTGMFSNAFNPSTGLGIKGETEKTLNKNVVFAENDKINKKKVNIAVYAFIPEEKGTFQVGVKVYDVNDNVIRDLHFDNVVLQQNHLTTYKGPLFTSGSTFEFSFDNNDFEKSDYDTTFGD